MPYPGAIRLFPVLKGTGGCLVSPCPAPKHTSVQVWKNIQETSEQSPSRQQQLKMGLGPQNGVVSNGILVVLGVDSCNIWREASLEGNNSLLLAFPEFQSWQKPLSRTGMILLNMVNSILPTLRQPLTQILPMPYPWEWKINSSTGIPRGCGSWS